MNKEKGFQLFGNVVCNTTLHKSFGLILTAVNWNLQIFFRIWTLNRTYKKVLSNFVLEKIIIRTFIIDFFEFSGLWWCWDGLNTKYLDYLE